MRRDMFHILILLAFATTGCGRASERATNDQAVETSIRDLTKTYVSSANARDVDKVVAFYTADAVLLPPNHEAVQGHESIHRYFKSELMDAGFSNFDNQTIKVEHAGDLAYQRGTYVFQIAGKDGSNKIERGKYVVVWRRLPNGDWRMLIDSWSNNSPQ